MDTAGRILALDLGTRRIGIAISDELGITAQGLPTLLRKNIRSDLDALATLVKERGVTEILLGDPKRMNGEEGRQSEWAREFALRLQNFFSLPVTMWDERLTSREAERTLRGSGVPNGDRKAAIDRLSAVILLQSYMDSRALQNERSAEPAA